MTNDSRGGDTNFGNNNMYEFFKKRENKNESGKQEMDWKMWQQSAIFFVVLFFPAMTNNIARKIITTKDFGVYTQIPAAQQQQQLFIYLCI